MLRYMKFYWDCGRMGCLRGKFVVNQDEYDRLMGLVGKQIYFGEVLGKHSEIYGKLKAEDLEMVCDDQAFLKKAQELGVDLDSGFNPLNDADEDEDEDEDDEAGE
jgi:hypothetical protein